MFIYEPTSGLITSFKHVTLSLSLFQSRSLCFSLSLSLSLSHSLIWSDLIENNKEATNQTITDKNWILFLESYHPPLSISNI